MNMNTQKINFGQVVGTNVVARSSFFAMLNFVRGWLWNEQIIRLFGKAPVEAFGFTMAMVQIRFDTNRLCLAKFSIYINNINYPQKLLITLWISIAIYKPKWLLTGIFITLPVFCLFEIPYIFNMLS